MCRISPRLSVTKIEIRMELTKELAEFFSCRRNGRGKHLIQADYKGGRSKVLFTTDYTDFRKLYILIISNLISVRVNLCNLW